MFSGPASGIWDSPNPWSAVPAGSLRVADNVDFTAPGILGPRRGFDVMSGGSFGDADSLADAFVFYGEQMLLAYDFTRIALRVADGEFVDFIETFEPNGANRMRFEPAARSMFFNPVDGIRVWDGTGNSSIASAAIVPGISFAFDGGSGTLTAGALLEAEVAAVPVGEGLNVATVNTATGTIFLLGSISGVFPNNADLAGLASFVGVVNGSTSIVLYATPADVAWWVAGLTVTGDTSGAIGVITANAIVGADRAVTVSVTSGTFVAETVDLSNFYIGQPQFAGNPQPLSITTVNTVHTSHELDTNVRPMRLVTVASVTSVLLRPSTA